MESMGSNLLTIRSASARTGGIALGSGTKPTLSIKDAEAIKKQAERFVSFEGDNAAIIVNNADWLLDLNYIEFMRDIGSKFTISRMLAQECYKTRLETGLTFFEMGYLLLQSYIPLQ